MDYYFPPEFHSDYGTPEGLCGDPPPRRETRERIAPTISARTKGGGGLGTDFDCDGGLIAARESGADRRQFDEDDIAQRLLRIVGDAHRADGAIDADIFVVFGVEGLRHDLSHPR